MKYFLAAILILFTLASCRQKEKAIVNIAYVDSLLSHYTQPAAIKNNEQDIEFWFKRIGPDNTGITNESKYASALITRFNLLGDINDVIKADSILKKVDEAYAHKEASPKMALYRHAILCHRFAEADSLLTDAKKTGIKPYDAVAASFDIYFEQGRTFLAQSALKSMASKNDYGFNFRNAKMEHYNGDIDNSIAAMKKAAELAGNDVTLKQAALSNLADLYLHSGDLQNAYDLYKQSIDLDAADLHSIMGIGWIALVHDKKDTLAEKIFLLVHTKTKAPDPLFKLVQTYMARGDNNSALQYARQFEQQVIQPVYGNMYNKYLIELYTGILNEPAKAQAIAEKELANRNTPQTNAWYVWALLKNNKADQAYNVYQKHVSGKPLEGLELYWMGKLMQQLKKGYNANQFFKEALKNKYDLSPVYINDLKKAMED